MSVASVFRKALQHFGNSEFLSHLVALKCSHTRHGFISLSDTGLFDTDYHEMEDHMLNHEMEDHMQNPFICRICRSNPDHLLSFTSHHHFILQAGLIPRCVGASMVVPNSLFGLPSKVCNLGACLNP